MSKQMTMTIETITPQIAAEYLKMNIGNRPPKKGTISVYARDMAAGKWLLSPQGVAFDTNGILIDGQNRLFAVIKSGATIEMAVFRDVAPEVREVLDDGVKRNTSDVLAFEGEQNTVSIAAVCLRLLAHSNGLMILSGDTSDKRSGVVSNRFSRSEQLEYFAANRDMVLDLVDFGRHTYKQMSIRIATGAELSLLLYIFGMGTDARKFISDVAVGVNLVNDTSGFLLRQRLVRSATGEARLSGNEKLALWKKAYDKRGTTVKTLKLNQ